MVNTQSNNSAMPSALPLLRLVQITDPHNFTDLNASIRGANPAQSLSRVLSYAQPFIDQSDAVLLTGDLAHDEHEHTYKYLREKFNAFDKPVYALPGNHDNPMEMSHILSGKNFAYLGHHSMANWEIICLDSHCPHQASGLLGESEIERLSLRLKSSDAEHFLIALHHHALPVGSSWLDSVGLKDADALLAVISQDTRVKVVCCGHVHQCFERETNGTKFITTPSTGTQFEPHRNDYTLDTKPPGFRWINLYADGSVQTQTVWLNIAPWT